jgi:hypothetical protein
MTQTIAEEPPDGIAASGRGICSVCSRDLLPGQPVLLDPKRYDPARFGDDWTWRHQACDTMRT